MVLAVDISASSAFGSLRRTKREFATEIAGTLAISAARSSDKVALLLFSDQVEFYLPPRKGRRHILRLLREMLVHEPKHRGTNIPAALAFLNHILHRRSIVFLLTDFLHSFAAAQQTAGTRDTLQEIGLTNARHDVVCLHLHDPREIELPSAGLVTVEDAETGEMQGEFKGHEGPVTKVVFLEDGKNFVSCGFDATAIIWRIPEGSK